MLRNGSLSPSGQYLPDKSSRSRMPVFIMCVALVGHSLVFLAIYRERSLRIIPNLIILNLSAADFLFGVIIPSVHLVCLIHDQSSLKGAPCHIIGIAGVLFCLVSIYTLTFVSIERYMATSYPIKHRRRFNIRLVKITLASIWCWSALLIALSFRTSRYIYVEMFFHCSPDWANDLFTTPMIFVFWIVLPQIILIYCNVHVLRAIHKSRNIQTGSDLDASCRFVYARLQRERQISIITTTVVVGFAVCWAPYGTAIVCLVSSKCIFPENFNVIVLMLSAFNSCLNPIIYGVLNKNFRIAFKNILCCK